jgi:hypothetical protein
LNRDLRWGAVLGPGFARHASHGVIAASLVAPHEVDSVAERYRKYFAKQLPKRWRNFLMPWKQRELWAAKEMDLVLKNLRKG